MAKNECDPKESQEAIKATYSFIVAVDVGTTYTKVAWKPTKTAEQDIYLFIDDQWESQRKVPTAALYRDQSTSLFSRGARELEFVAFGFEAMQQYNEEREKGLALFKKFKMQLHDKKVGTLSYRVLQPPDGLAFYITFSCCDACEYFADRPLNTANLGYERELATKLLKHGHPKRCYKHACMSALLQLKCRRGWQMLDGCCHCIFFRRLAFSVSQIEGFPRVANRYGG